MLTFAQAQATVDSHASLQLVAVTSCWLLAWRSGRAVPSDGPEAFANESRAPILHGAFFIQAMAAVIWLVLAKHDAWRGLAAALGGLGGFVGFIFYCVFDPDRLSLIHHKRVRVPWLVCLSISAIALVAWPPTSSFALLVWSVSLCLREQSQQATSVKLRRVDISFSSRELRSRLAARHNVSLLNAVATVKSTVRDEATRTESSGRAA